ncbi:hypothetical protein X975_14599, partial [Stegodyphus mimosarum]
MKFLVALFFFAMVAVAMSQSSYNYGYNTHTPGAVVSHHASSGWAGLPNYAYNYHYGAYPYRWW